MSGYPQQQFPGSPMYPPAKPASGNPFAEQVNPYAAPQVAGYQPNMPGVGANPFAGLWRQGNMLVMHKMAPLPDICLKSNQPATRRLKRTLHWHHPAIFIAVLISALFYIILALILQKRAIVQMAMTEEWFARRRMRMLIAWGLGLFGILLGIGAGVLHETLGEATPLIIFLAFIVALGGLIYGLIACRMITPQRITDQYVWIKGVHPEFLNRLEVWMWNV
jgi:hypothetical protein